MTTENMIEEINKNENKRERLEEYKSRFSFKQHKSENEVEYLQTFKDYVEYLYYSPDLHD